MDPRARTITLCSSTSNSERDRRILPPAVLNWSSSQLSMLWSILFSFMIWREEEPESDVLGPGAGYSVSRHAQCSCAVAVDGDLGESLESQFHQKVGKVYRLPCPVAKCLKLALHSRLSSE